MSGIWTPLHPDYRRNSIVNLMSSVVSGLGGEPTPEYPPLSTLPPERIDSARNVVLLVVDGLGYHQLMASDNAPFMRSQLIGRIDTVFPTTTAAAVTTFLTATAPQQHGVTGWFGYYRELGSVIATLPFRARHGGAPLGNSVIEAERFFGHTPVFDRLHLDCWMVSPARIAYSDYNRAHAGRATIQPYASLSEMFTASTHIIRGSGARTFIYAYWSDLDAIAHQHGSASAEAAQQLGEIDAGLERFVEALRGTDTLVIVTADHGFVDTRPDTRLELADHPQLAETLTLPLCGEPRIAYCYVEGTRIRDFHAYVDTELAHAAVAVPSAELIHRGLFGVGSPHPELHRRIGHYTLVMSGHFALRDRLPVEKPHELIGVHGGLTAEELHVPLVVSEY